MRKVIGIGETVLDIIFKDGQPVSATPGGSVFNSIISLGRAGVQAAFISETGDDRIGRDIINFLSGNGIDASAVSVFPGSRSHLSLAFLNEDNDAEYIFYKDHPHDRIESACPEINKDDIVMFGSYYAVNPVIRNQVAALLNEARKNGAIIYYDVNYRASHAGEVMKLTPNILENFEFADIVRGSREDFKIMYGTDSPEEVYNSKISFYCKDFIYTDGAQPVKIHATGGFKKSYTVEPAATVSTIGAGDNFNAGLVYGLIRYGITRDDLCNGTSEETWDKLTACALAFAANCCASIGNTIDRQFGDKMKAQLG